jgi:tetratricopeptide (TPR) repeat protein
MKNDRDHAAADFDQSMRLKPNNGPALFGRGALSYSQNNYLHSIEDLDRAVALLPKFQAAFYLRGLAQRGHPQNRVCSG